VSTDIIFYHTNSSDSVKKTLHRLSTRLYLWLYFQWLQSPQTHWHGLAWAGESLRHSLVSWTPV